MIVIASLQGAVPVAVAIVAGAISVALILALSPWLKAYALARPNARSSHREPTPQGVLQGAFLSASTAP